jgi:deoxyribonuclease V
MKWPGTFMITEARALQEQLRRKVRISPFPGEPRFVAGVDAAFSGDRVFAVACVYRFPDLVPLDQAMAVRKLSFPYVPGYLSFREGPAIIDALSRLRQPPDLVLVDGQGIAHPRGFGIASFIGVLLNVPAIGCAKSLLIGTYDEPGFRKGDWSPLAGEERIIGAVVRTRDRTRPLFVSAGHRMNLDSAIRFTLECTHTYRIPEPLRCADRLSKERSKTSRNLSP